MGKAFEFVLKHKGMDPIRVWRTKHEQNDKRERQQNFSTQIQNAESNTRKRIAHKSIRYLNMFDESKMGKIIAARELQMSFLTFHNSQPVREQFWFQFH